MRGKLFISSLFGFFLVLTAVFCTASTDLPDVYDPRDKLPPPRPTGWGITYSAWNCPFSGKDEVFGFVRTIEACLIRYGRADAGIDLSENSLSNIERYLYRGFLASAYLAEGSQPVAEACDPLPDDIYNPDPNLEHPDCPRLFYIEKSRFLPVMKPPKTEEDVRFLKDKIYRHGGVAVLISRDKSCWDDNLEYYFCGVEERELETKLTFLVTLIGWDDNVQVPGAPKPGAFIAKSNDLYELGGDDGYFYIPYWDWTIAYCGKYGKVIDGGYFIDEPDINGGDFVIYQHDDNKPLLSEDSFNYYEKRYSSNWGASVFHAEEDLYLRALVFFGYDNERAELEVYLNCEHPADCVMVREPDVRIAVPADFWGYDTVRLEKPLFIPAGTPFCIAEHVEKGVVPLEEKVRASYISIGEASGQSWVWYDWSEEWEIVKWERITDAFCPHLGDVILKAILTRTPFEDVGEGSWAFQYISELYRAGLTAGCSTDPPMYCPDRDVTRAQMAVFVLKALGIKPAETCTGKVFSDVNAQTVGEGFCRYIEKFAELGITAGCTADDPSTPENEARYCPNEPVTRQQMAVFLTKALGYGPADACKGERFRDVDSSSVGDSFCRYIERFAELGITGGCRADDPSTPENEAAYCPHEPVKRDQMAVFLIKARDKVK